MSSDTSSRPSPAISSSSLDIDALRADTPGCAGRVHLNNAGASLMPRPVIAALHEHLDLEAEIGGYEAADLRAAEIAACYGAFADLLGCAPRNIAMVENATAGYLQALSAIPFAAGDIILTTRHDYASNQIMFLSLARRFGVEVIRADDAPQGGVDVDAMDQLMRAHRPRLVAVSHVPTHSGLIQPVAAIGRSCRELGLVYLVDGCQAIGQLPVDVGDIGCDFFAGTCRKFLRGPRGAGFLYVSDRLLDEGYEPLFPDLHGAEWTAADAYRASASARRYENWEFAYALVLASGVAARYLLQVGVDAASTRACELAAYARQRLREIGLRVLDRGPRLAAIVTVEVPGIAARELQLELRRRHINTSFSTLPYARLDFADKGVEWALRVSPHYFNTRDEIEQLIDHLREIVFR